MNELPELVFLKIFGCLPICDQVNVRGVCRLWKQFADECLRLRRELIVLYELVPLRLFWAHNGQPINLKNSVIVNWKFNQSDYFAEIFRNVQRLYIAYYSKQSRSEHAKFLHLAREPEHLQIQNVLPYLNQTLAYEVNIESEALRTLSLSSHEPLVSLKCPNLRWLSFYGSFHLTNEMSPWYQGLEVLSVNSFSYELGAELASLKVLQFRVNIEIDIDHFPSLKELHYVYHPISLHQNLVEERKRKREMVVEKLNGFLEQKETKSRSDLAVYYDGFPYRDDREFRDYLVRGLGFSPRWIGNFFDNPISMKCYPGPSNLADFACCLQNSKLENTLKGIAFEGYDDEDLLDAGKEMSEGVVEKLSRSLVVLQLGGALIEKSLIPQSRELFKYVKFLYICTMLKEKLNLLPDIVPNVVYVCNGSYESHLSFLSRFRALKDLSLRLLKMCYDDLEAILNNCKICRVSWISWTDCGRKRSSIKLAPAYCRPPGLSFENEGQKTIFQTKEELLEHLVQIEWIVKPAAGIRVKRLL